MFQKLKYFPLKSPGGLKKLNVAVNIELNVQKINRFGRHNTVRFEQSHNASLLA